MIPFLVLLVTKYLFRVRIQARELLFAWTGRLDDGTPLFSRTNWINTAGDGVGLPVAANENPHQPEDNALGQKSDSAANPTRAIPGELVMKVDFVDTSVATGGDFFDYKPITGM